MSDATDTTPSRPHRVRDMFASAEELAQYLRAHPHVLRSIPVRPGREKDSAKTAWAMNSALDVAESKSRVRRLVDSMFNRGEEHRVETIIVANDSPELTDRTVEIVYQGERLGREDARNLGRSADITIVDVIDQESGESIKDKLTAKVHDDLLERASEDFASREFDHLDRFADDD